MATENSSKKLSNVTICDTCLSNPVLLDCGHSACQFCLLKYWEEFPLLSGCPWCRRTVQLKSSRSKKKLINVVGSVNQPLLAQTTQGASVEQACKTPQESSDVPTVGQASVSSLDDESQVHNVASGDEVAQEYEDKLGTHLNFLQKKRQEILDQQARTKSDCDDLTKIIEEQKQNTSRMFQVFRKCLLEWQQPLLARMRELGNEIVKQRDTHVAKLSKEVSFLDVFIQEVKEKSQQPVSEVLQDIESFLKRYEETKLTNPFDFPSPMTWETWSFGDGSTFLSGIMERFKGTLMFDYPMQQANVTLDPKTAHPLLILSEDRKSLSLGDQPQDLTRNPKRFDQCHYVLGCEGFARGRHYWDVTIGAEEDWGIGIARKSVKRKGTTVLSPLEGIWAMGKLAGRYVVLNSPNFTPLSPSQELKKIRVSLNCGAAQLTFINCEGYAVIFAFTMASVSETFHPFFWLKKEGYLSLSP